MFHCCFVSCINQFFWSLSIDANTEYYSLACEFCEIFICNMQVAELMAFMAKNRRLSYCKVVEVIAKTNAPLRPMDELLMKIPYQRVPPKVLCIISLCWR